MVGIKMMRQIIVENVRRKEIEKVDNGANNEISKKDALDAYGVRPPNPSSESQENKKDK